MTYIDPPPEASEALFLGSELAARKDFERAEAAFAKAVLLAPDWTIARYQLGLLQLGMARANTALVTWLPLMNLHLEDPLGHFVRGFAAIARDEFPEATGHFKAGLACGMMNRELAADIEKVLARIAKVEPSTAAEGAHLLLSNHGRLGNLH